MLLAITGMLGTAPSAQAISRDRANQIALRVLTPERDRGRIVVVGLYLKSEDGRRIGGPAEVKRSNLNGCRDGANASIVLKESRLKKGKDLATVKYCGRTFSWSSPADRGFNVSVRVA
jgi:hypothetical protein